MYYGIPSTFLIDFHTTRQPVRPIASEQTVRVGNEENPSLQMVFNQSISSQSQQEEKLELYSDLPGFMLEKAKRLFQEGKKKEALAILLKAKTDEMHSLESLLLIGAIAKELQLENKDEDADYFTIAKDALLEASSNPSVSEYAYENLGFLHLQANKPDLAIEAFLKIKNPKVSILLLIARSKYSRNEYEESLKYYFRAYFNRFAKTDEKKEALEKLYSLSLKLEKITDAFSYGELLDRLTKSEVLQYSHFFEIIQFYCREDSLKPLKACFTYLIRKRIQKLEPYGQILEYLGRIGQYNLVIELSKKILDRLFCIDPAFAKHYLILAYYAEENFKQCYETAKSLDYTKCESREVLWAWGFSSLKNGFPIEASIIFSKMLSRSFLRKHECLLIFHEFGCIGHSELALLMLNRSELFSDFEKKQYSEQLKGYSERLKPADYEPALSEKESTDREEEEEELEVGSLKPGSANFYFLNPEPPINLSKEEPILEFKKSAELFVKNLFFDTDLRSLMKETFQKFGIYGIPFPSEKGEEYLEKLHNFVMNHPERRAESFYLAKLLISNFLPLCPLIGENFYSIYDRYPELAPIFKTSQFSVLAIRAQILLPIFPINELLDLFFYLTLRHIEFGTAFEDLLPPSTFYISLKVTQKNVVFATPFALSIKKSSIEIKKTALPEISLGELHEQLGLNRKGISRLLDFISQKENKVIARLEGVPLIEEGSDFYFKVEENSFTLFNTEALSALYKSFAEASFISFPKLPSLPPLFEQTWKRPIFLKSNLKGGAASLFSVLINQSHSLKSPFFFILEENNKNAFLKELKKQAVLHFLNRWITVTDLNAYKINVFYSDYKSISAFFKEELIEYKQNYQNINLTLEEKKQKEANLDELNDLMGLLTQVKIIIDERASKLNLFMIPRELDEPIPSFNTFLTNFSSCPNESKKTKVIICGLSEWEQINENNFNYPTLYLLEKSDFILEELSLIEKLAFKEVSHAYPPIFSTFKTAFNEILNSVVYTISNNFDLKVSYSLLKVLFLMNETYLREKQNFTEELENSREIESGDEKENLQIRFKNFLEQINRYFLRSEKPRIIIFEEISFILNSFIMEDANQLILDLKKPNYKAIPDFEGSGNKKRMHVAPLPRRTNSETDFLKNLSEKISILSKRKRRDFSESEEIPNESFSNEVVIKPEDLFLIKEK